MTYEVLILDICNAGHALNTAPDRNLKTRNLYFSCRTITPPVGSFPMYADQPFMMAILAACAFTIYEMRL